MINHSRPTIGPKERHAVDRVLRSGFLAQGKEVEDFEKESARFLGLKGAVAVSSGTKALELTLRALGAGPGGEVLIPSYVCSALWLAVTKTGAEPVLVDSEANGIQMSMRDAARKRTRKTQALILPHLFGEAGDIAGAKALGIPVIEDCAQSLGGNLAGKRLGSFGAACILSFYATKLLTTGEGGMVVSSNMRLLSLVRDWREYDEKRPSSLMENAKMTDLQAALGRVQLKRLPEFLKTRERIARAYNRAFGDLKTVRIPSSLERIYFRYILCLRSGNLDHLIKSLNRLGVSARRPVFRPLHRDVPCRGTFPGAERAWRECLSLPIYPSLSERQDQQRVIRAVFRALRHASQ